MKPFYMDNSYAAVKKDGNWGFADKDGNMVIAPQYEDARSFSYGYAVVKTKENLTKLQAEQAKKVASDQENKEQALKLKEQIDKIIIEFKVKTGEADRVFGSISVKQIKDELAKMNFNIEKSQIELTNPIASLGFHNVQIKLYPGIEATIKVHLIK